tara:strand:- start:45 stop:425 length:381 start_codon:yes stop_codon:yes gene_type:complete
MRTALNTKPFDRKFWRKIYMMQLPNTLDMSTIGCRGRTGAKIAELAVNGKVAVYSWGRDCDMCESDGVTLLPAHLMAYTRYENEVYDNAEGPTSVYPISMDEAADFEPSFRDRIAEAWDNGNTYCV